MAAQNNFLVRRNRADWCFGNTLGLSVASRSEIYGNPLMLLCMTNCTANIINFVNISFLFFICFLFLGCLFNDAVNIETTYHGVNMYS
jgi:hypothetical protein